MHNREGGLPSGWNTLSTKTEGILADWDRRRLALESAAALATVATVEAPDITATEPVPFIPQQSRGTHDMLSGSELIAATL